MVAEVQLAPPDVVEVADMHGVSSSWLGRQAGGLFHVPPALLEVAEMRGTSS